MKNPFEIADEIFSLLDRISQREFVITKYKTGGRMSSYIKKKYHKKSMDWVIRISDHKPSFNPKQEKIHCVNVKESDRVIKEQITTGIFYLTKR